MRVYAIHCGRSTDVVFSGCRLIYLPPYSPDFNPIELAFSSIKADLRRNNHLIQAHLTGKKEDHAEASLLLTKSIYSVTPEKARAWFHHCNYI